MGVLPGWDIAPFRAERTTLSQGPHARQHKPTPSAQPCPRSPPDPISNRYLPSDPSRVHRPERPPMNFDTPGANRQSAFLTACLGRWTDQFFGKSRGPPVGLL